MKDLQSIDDILKESEKLELYKKLLQQLNKDFILAGIATEFESDISPVDLKEWLYNTILDLIRSNFSNYLNLLYVIDVNEKEVKAIESIEQTQISKEVSFLILKRQWQKVWYRNKF